MRCTASWLSGVYYPQVPAAIRAPVDPGDPSGCLELGADDLSGAKPVSPELIRVRPAEGLLVLFPLGTWHRSWKRASVQTSPLNDAVDAVDARPAFGVLIYPVISMDPAIAHAGSKRALLGDGPSAADVTLYSSEKQVTSSTPATFIGVSNKDAAVKPANSLRFDDALKAGGVASELHVYQDGGHGTGLNATGDMAAWPKQCAAWLATLP